MRLGSLVPLILGILVSIFILPHMTDSILFFVRLWTVVHESIVSTSACDNYNI